MRVSRRRLVALGAGGLAAAALARPLRAVAALPVRTLGFHNLHTGERFDGAYWAEGRYLPDALAEVRRVLRDFRTGDEHAIDPGLLDLLTALKGRMESSAAFEVISGYRSPATNAMLHESSAGVASHSFHMQGKAIDIRLPGSGLAHLHEAALGMQAGGVGYYPASDFVHVDVGPVRRW